MMLLLLRGLIVGLLLATSFAPFATELPDLVATVRPSVVGIGTFVALRSPQHQLSGTGFIVGDGHLVITNYHVVAGSEMSPEKSGDLVVFIGRGRTPDVRRATVAAEDRFHDLAVLKITGPAGPSLTLNAALEVREGGSVAIMGFPIGAVLGLYPATNSGIVSAVSPIAIPQGSPQALTAAQIRRLRDPFEVYQLDIIAYPGNSGSPVFDVRSGTVIGVVNSVLARSGKEGLLKDPSAITYAIPIQHALKLLEIR